MLERHFFYKKTRNSQTFRKNCFFVVHNGNYYLISYETVVCCVDNNGYFHKYWDNWSSTTQNQINCFIDKLLSDNLVKFVKKLDNTGNFTGFCKKDWENYKLSDNSEIPSEIYQTIPEIEWNYTGWGEFGQNVRKIRYNN